MVDHLTQVTHTLIPGLTGSTSYHRVIKLSQGILPVFECLPVRPALPGHSRLRASAHGVD